MNAFNFPTRDNQKDNGLEIEFMLDSGAACSIINYGTFVEIAQIRHPITVVRSKQKKTYTGDIVPMIGHTTLSFGFDSEGKHQFELRIRIETQTSNLLGVEFCRQYVSKLHFEIPAIENKSTANAICMVTCVQLNPIPLSQRYILLEHLIRSKVMPKPPEFGKTYRKINRKVSRQEPLLFLIDTQTNQDWTLSMYYGLNLKPIYPCWWKRTEITIQHWIKELLDTRHSISQTMIDPNNKADCVQMVNSILAENDQYNECFLHSTVPCEPDLQDKIQILNGNEEAIFQANTAIAHCISAGAKMSKSFAETICRRVNWLQEYCRKAKAIVGSALPYWDQKCNNYI